MILTERSIQEFRAIAVNQQGGEHLLALGKSYSDVKKHYPVAFHELLTRDEQDSIRKIELQRWMGTADRGQWVDKGGLAIPKARLQIA